MLDDFDMLDDMGRAADVEPARKPVRRKRGLARIALILDAAAEEFAQVGYARATTNAIAARAGISPGSLYQYFSNKADIANALAQRYVEAVTHGHAGAFGDFDPTAGPLCEIVDRVIDPVIAFHVANPGFRALFSRTDLPGSLAGAVEPLEAMFVERVHDILHARHPGIPADTLRVYTHTLVLMVRGLLVGIAYLSPADRDTRAAEIKAAIIGYLNHHGIA